MKLCKVIDEQTQQVVIANEMQEDIFKKEGFQYKGVEQAYNGEWYLSGYAPAKPQSLINQEKITELKNKLSATDYICIKIAEGAATHADYAEIIVQRQAWRAEINRLEQENEQTNGVNTGSAN